MRRKINSTKGRNNLAKNKIKNSIISSVKNENSANELSDIVSEINENYQIISELIKNENISAEILSAVNSEAYSYPPALVWRPPPEPIPPLMWAANRLASTSPALLRIDIL